MTRAADLFSANLGHDPVQRAVALNILSLSEWALGRYEKAAEHVTEAILIWSESYGPDHPRTLRAGQNMGSIVRRQGRLDEAVDILQEVLRRQQLAVSPEPLEMARTRSILGVVYTDLGRYELAATTLEQAFEVRSNILGFDHSGTLGVRSNLARLDFLRGQVRQAEVAHRKPIPRKPAPS